MGRQILKPAEARHRSAWHWVSDIGEAQVKASPRWRRGTVPSGCLDVMRSGRLMSMFHPRIRAESLTLQLPANPHTLSQSCVHVA